MAIGRQERLPGKKKYGENFPVYHTLFGLSWSNAFAGNKDKLIKKFFWFSGSILNYELPDFKTIGFLRLYNIHNLKENRQQFGW